MNDIEFTTGEIRRADGVIEVKLIAGSSGLAIVLLRNFRALLAFYQRN